MQEPKAKESKQKRSRGRPKKGEEKDRTVQQIKGSAIALGKAPENLTESQKAKIDFIAATDKKLYRAYCLKEMLRTLIKIPADEIEPMPKSWLWKASHSRIAYGFRNIQNLIDMIMLRCSDIPIFLPGRL